LLQIGARDAAQAAITEKHGLISAGSHQRIVNAGRTKLIDDDGGALALRRIKETLEKRCLSRTEKAGDYDDRDARAAFALQSAAKAPGGG